MADIGTLNPEQMLQQQQILRQQKMAEMLMQQGMQQPQGQMVSGRYVAPSIFQNLAGLANTYMGQRGIEKAQQAQIDLAKAIRQGDIAATADFMATKQGRPEIVGTPDIPTETYETVKGIQGRAGIAPNPQAAYANLYADPRASARLQNLAFNKMMAEPEAFTLTKGAKRFVTMPDGSTKEVAAGAEDLPDSIQYAITIGQLPSNPKTWTPKQAALAKSIVESKTSAGANKFDFSNMLGKSVSDVAPILIASKTATGGAIQQADAANRIIQSLDTNKIFTGAGANQKLQAAQIGQMLGVTGGKTEEIVANTRTAIQGLAQLTLQGRKQMRGEGAITESEGALAQRAMSGDVSLTAGELRILANAAKRSAKFTYDQHQSMMGALAKDSPNSVPYYQLEVNPNIFATSSSDVRTKADEIINKPNKP
jgi:hypothetical protein